MVSRPLVAVCVVSVFACSRSALLDPDPVLEAGGRSGVTPSTSGGNDPQSYSRSGASSIGSRPNTQSRGGNTWIAPATTPSSQGGAGGQGTSSTFTEAVAERCPNTEFFGTHWFPIPAPVAEAPPSFGGTSDLNGDSIPDIVVGQAGVVSVLLGMGEGEFAPHRDFSTWKPMASPITADINRDGFADIVYLIPDWNSLRVIWGSANGLLYTESDLSVPSSTDRKLIASADFNTDGTNDLVISDTTTYLDVLEAVPNSTTFKRTQLITLSSPIARVHSVDLNADQRLDLITVGPQGIVSVYLQTDQHGFNEKVTTETKGAPQSVSFGFLDSDAFADLAGASNEKLFKCRGNGDGTFACDRPSTQSATLTRFVDVDADGTEDLVTADGVSGQLCTSAVTRDGTTTTPPTCIPFISAPLDMTAGDFDADGTLDLAVVGATTPAIGISWGGPARRRLTDFGLLTESIGSIPTAVQVTDYDNDRRLDVVVASTSSTDVRFWKGTGDGHFRYDSALFVGIEPKHLRTADFDDDGTVDVVAMDDQGNLVVTQGRKVVVLSQILYAPYDLIEVSDLNQDGHLDLFLAQTGTKNCLALLGLGTGQFQSGIAFRSTRELTRVTLGDLNQDRIPDLVIGTNSVVVEIDSGLGNGRFGSPISYSAKDSAAALTLADPNQDGIVDVIVGHHGLGASLLVGKGNLAFDYARFIELRVPAHDVAVADFDVDGQLDVIATDHQSKVLGLALGNGDASFSRSFPFFGNAIPTELNVGDVNRDGRPDIVYGDRASSTLVTRLNSCP